MSRRPELLTRLRERAERGSATVFVVGFAIILFAAAGLAIDGGRAINARERALDAAEQAARAGAAAVDIPTLRQPGGRIVLNRDQAEAAARNYLDNAGYVASDYVVDADANQVFVRVEFKSPTVLMGIINVNEIPISGEATAAPATGIGAAVP